MRRRCGFSPLPLSSWQRCGGEDVVKGQQIRFPTTLEFETLLADSCLVKKSRRYASDYDNSFEWKSLYIVADTGLLQFI